MYDFDDGPEPYENDLEELGNREAWEDAQAEMREEFEEGECPDCGEVIPEGTENGDECENCEHVFHFGEDSEEDEPLPYNGETPLGIELEGE